MLNIEITSDIMADGTCVIRPHGQLDAFTFTEFGKYFDEFCGQAKDLLVVVDLSSIAYIASSGWTVLLSRRQALRRMGGDLTVFGFQKEIQRIYDAMRIQKLLPAAETMVRAAKLLRRPEHPTPLPEEVLEVENLRDGRFN
jgi:anti-anti-sigma factor